MLRRATAREKLMDEESLRNRAVQPKQPVREQKRERQGLTRD